MRLGRNNKPHLRKVGKNKRATAQLRRAGPHPWVGRRDSSGNVNYYFVDHLGTARVVASATGTILDDSDFYPFGGERAVVASSGNNYKFTAKERDSESSLDYFGVRYYSSTIGRFLSSDPLGMSARLLNPQTWNLYAYVLNNPIKFLDPDGLEAAQATQVRTVTVDLGRYIQPKWDEIGPATNFLPLPNMKGGSEADAGGIEAQVNYQYGGSESYIVEVTFTTISVNGSYGNPVTGEGAYCSTSTSECLTAEINVKRDDSPAIDAKRGIVRGFLPWQNPNEAMWTSLNLSSMSTQQLNALKESARRKSMFELVRKIDQELDRRRREEEKKKKEKEKDPARPDKVGPGGFKSQ